MKRQNKCWRRQQRGMRRGFVIILLFVACVHQPVLSQEIRIERLQQSTAGGFAQSGDITLFSSVGAVTPSGRWQNDTFEITSGSRSLLNTMVALIRLAHVPSGPVQRGSSLTIDGRVPGATSVVQSATLQYRRGGANDYTSVAMNVSADQLRAEIPAEDVTSEGVAYHMELVNHQGQTIRSPAIGDYGVAVRVQAPGLVSSSALPGGTEQTAYRLVSVPLNLEAPDPDEVFVDDFGQYDPADWRLFAVVEDQNTREFASIEAVDPGEGFWLITRESQDGFDTGPGVTANPADAFAVALHPSWNLIGNPFHFSLPTANLSLQSGEPLDLRSFEGSWSNPLDDEVASLEPFSGYAVFNPTESVDTLYFDPQPAVSTGKVGTRVASSSQHELSWSIRILAHSGRAKDTDNVAGVATSASEGHDPMDYPEPPTLGSFVSVYFTHPEWTDRLTAAYATDIRSAEIDGATWDFDVRSGTGETVHLSFDGVEDIPSEFRIWLIDELTGVVTDLRDQPSYSLSDPGPSKPRSLRIVAGNSTYTSKMMDQLELIPKTVELEPVFPNPVRRSMTIQYGLPKSTNVTLRIYNATGQLVQELMNEPKAEGRHSVVWEPSSVPARLANGVYILELRAGGARRSQMVTLLQ